jgi:hypothetical protein
MPRDQALQVLNGAIQPPPEAIPALEQLWTRHVAAVQQRPDFEPRSPVVTNLPLSAKRQLKALVVRPDLRTTFAPHSWELGVVDLSAPILTFQSVVQTEDAAQRVSQVQPDDWDALIELCLPSPVESQFEGGYDLAQSAFTISSLNPNLRVMSFEVVDVAPANPEARPKKVFGFTIGLGGSFVQFVEYQNRWMVRDGNHRLYGLLKAGITAVPAVLIHAKSFEETGAGRPGFFGHEQLYGPRPPQLRDFIDDELSAEVSVRATRKVVRLRAEEFAVLV